MSRARRRMHRRWRKQEAEHRVTDRWLAKFAAAVRAVRYDGTAHEAAVAMLRAMNGKSPPAGEGATGLGLRGSLRED